MTQSERFTQEGGVWTWDATVDYAASRLVLGSNGKLYWSVAQSGPNVGGAQDPTADDGTYWTAIPSDDSDVVHINGDEDIVGYKTFTSGERISNNHGLLLKDNDHDITVAPGDNSNCYIQFVDKNDLAFSAIQRHYYASGANAVRIMIRGLGDDSTTLPNLNSVGLTVTSALVYHFSPTQESINLGYTSGFRWAQVYAKSATISTSDARFKTEPEPVPDDVLDAWGEVDFVQFQMLDAVADKGADKARLHSGLIAQRIDQAFKARGLDASRYGLFCWDSWEAEPEERDEHGAVVEPARPAGDEYSLRYEEALCMEAAYQRRRADRAEARLAALEERLAALEAKVG